MTRLYATSGNSIRGSHDRADRSVRRRVGRYAPDVGMEQSRLTPQPTVVITNYDYGRFLEQSIRSAIGQTGVAVEVIVVDDGSDDESVEVLHPFEQSITSI